MMINFRNPLRVHKLLLPIYLLTLISIAGCAAQIESRTSKELEQSKVSKVITSITTEKNEDEFTVFLKGSENLAFTSVRQPFPAGVLLYFPNTQLHDIPEYLEFADGVVESIKTTEFNQDSQKVRIEILLRNDAGYRAVKKADGVMLAFKQSKTESINAISSNDTKESDSSVIVPAALSNSMVSDYSIRSAVYDPPKFEKKEQTIPIKTVSNNSETRSESKIADKTKTVNVDTMKAAWMNRIDFSSETNGKSTLIIGTTIPIGYELKKITSTKINLQLLNTNIPKYRQRPLITTRFMSAVDRVLPFQTSATGKSSIVSIELREEVPFSVEQTDTLLFVHFESSNIPPRPLDEANLPDWQQVIARTTIESSSVVAPAEATAETSAGMAVEKIDPEMKESDLSLPGPESIATYSQVYAAGEFGTGKKIYIGEKIALDFYKTDIKNVFRILREVSGKNFAIDKDVNGSVTLTLDKPVPWDQVLDLVLKMNQLGMIYEQDIIRIATLETLRKEEDQRSAQLEAAKKAKEQKESLEPIFTEYIPVNYSQATTEVMPHVKNILTKDRGSVTVDGRNNQIIITDTKEVIRQARTIVKRIDKVTPQVVIEARVVEVSSNFSRELGIEWNADYGPSYSDVLDMDFDGNLAMNFPASGATSSVGFNFSRLDGLPFVLKAKINALESQGDGKILSSPKIVTLDNKKARIKQGLEYPYLERDDAGGSSVKFKNIDLLLEVTPHVTPDNRISMSIFITKNDVAGITDGIPSIATNEAETELLVNDGDTIVIGGIIKASESGGESGFPGLSKIPILGWLFKNETNSDQKNELLIFMTPRIVQLEQL